MVILITTKQPLAGKVTAVFFSVVFVRLLLRIKRQHDQARVVASTCCQRSERRAKEKNLFGNSHELIFQNTGTATRSVQYTPAKFPVFPVRQNELSGNPAVREPSQVTDQALLSHIFPSHRNMPCMCEPWELCFRQLLNWKMQRSFQTVAIDQNNVQSAFDLSPQVTGLFPKKHRE